MLGKEVAYQDCDFDDWELVSQVAEVFQIPVRITQGPIHQHILSLL